MKKILLLVAVLTIGIGTAHAQQTGLDNAIRDAVGELSSGLRTNPSVAVVAMHSGSAAMSNYLIDEMNVAFFHTGGLRLTERVQLAGFNMHAAIDDATAQSIGRLLGVQYVVTGTLEPLAGFFRFRTRIIDAETGALRGIHTADVRNDTLVASLLGAGDPAAFLPPAAAWPPPAAVPQATVGQFTLGQRWATWALNGIPGLGSFIIMSDRFGGFFQVASGGLGYILYISSILFPIREPVMLWGQHMGMYNYRVNPVLLFGGLALIATQQIFNIVRSATFGRGGAVAVASMPSREWDIVLVSDENRIGGISLSHTLRF